jgi:hypothetical protein
MLKMSKRRCLTGGGAVTAIIDSGVACKTLVPTTYPAQSVYTVGGIALGSTDTVAYFTQNKPIARSHIYAAGWNGVAWHFASAQNHDSFAAAPEHFAPQYGGLFALGRLQPEKALFNSSQKLDN